MTKPNLKNYNFTGMVISKILKELLMLLVYVHYDVDMTSNSFE